MKNTLELGKIIKEEHENKWVALSKDKTKVVDFDENLVRLKHKVGDEKVVYMKVPPPNL